jgi:deoxycytidine triphosphate deaminase
MLGKSQLKRMLERGKITCEPITPVSISECSIDVRLASKILYPKIESENSCYEFRVDDYGGFEVEPVGVDYVEYDISKSIFTLRPGKFVLASTIERIGQDNADYGCIILGKSSLARCGLQVEAAGLVEPGNALSITLEICNVGNVPVRLVAGMMIAQVYWQRIDRPWWERILGLFGWQGSLYSGKYKGSDSVEPPR